MKVTQEQLNKPLFSITGEPFDFKKDEPLTMRFVLIETLLYADDKRSGTDRLAGVALSEKVLTPMGDLDFDEADVKLIETRMDDAPVLTNNDYLYTLTQRFLHPTATPETASE